MGQYKVPQNVEAEDKILGPLTFKEFIYFLIGFGWAALCFMLFRSIFPVMILLGAPPTILFLLLAFYHRDGQDFEHILLATLSFFAKNRKRVWVKNDLIETFHVQPAAVTQMVNQRNPQQVLSELEKLSRLIDSRGWNHAPEPGIPTTSDRIVPNIPAAAMPAEAPDMLDMQKSPQAANIAQMLQAAAADVRQQAVQQMVVPAAPAPAAVPAAPSISGVTAAPANDILKLATQSDELKVSQLAAQANRVAQPAQTLEVPTIGS